MTQTILKKKKLETILERLVDIDFSELTQDDRIEITEKLRKRLLEIFKFHIGESNAIFSSDLFENIYLEDVSKVDYFKARYLFQLINLMLSKMRMDSSLFVINKHGYKYFVVKTLEEANEFKSRMNRIAKSYIYSGDKCVVYVKKQKWKELLK